MNDTLPLLSVIVPIYNKAFYLDNCINSVIAACKMEETEILLIDDGSKDNSGQIADKFASDYNNIMVIHTKNSGVSAARNFGLNIAKGKYITFVDADDMVIKDSFANALVFANTDDADLFICGATWGNGDLDKCDLIDATVLQSENKPVFDNFLTGGGYGRSIQNSARKFMWGCKEKFYRHDFLSSSGILFEESLSRNEDVLFSLECYYCARKVRFLPINVYINLDDPNSLTSTMNAWKNLFNFETFFDIFSRKYQEIDDRKLALFAFQHTLTLLREAYLALSKKSITKNNYDSILTKWFERSDVCKMFTSMPLSKLSYPKKVAYFLLKYKFFILVGIEMEIYTRMKSKNIHI